MMGWFRCEMIGVNFPGKLVGDSRPIGFSVTRYVEADNKKEARTAAIRQLQMDLNRNLNMGGDVSFTVPSKLTYSGQAEVRIDKIEPLEFSEIPEFEEAFWCSPMESEGDVE